ncbi:peptidoglycan/xylan/chitin deacetylase (PgdA/CDA1 family) [Streptomyces sp. TLI_235]|nr:polysaccharide deacetylase family protein [Streptomyces sp. TLI_235]PBC71834.1 peptidoglycan/xylan/chitin deacetylase (PgdA/CDA1 family) [Streptomyces sp. TLI_235]
MRIPSPRSRRTLGLGLAALLAPTVIAACGSAGHARTASADGARTTAAAVTPRDTAATGGSPSPASPAPSIPAQRSAPPSTSGSATPSTPATTPSAGTATPAAPSTSATPSTHTPTGGPTTGPTRTHQVIRSTATGGRTVALTFDDGPGPATRPILDLLAQYHAKATFCMVGNEVDRDPAAVRRVLAEGHRLCDHTVDHPQPLHGRSHDQQVHEIADAKQTILRAGGPGAEVPWFRAPGGDFTAENEQIAADHGMASLGWSVDPRDWARPGVPAIVANVQQHLRPGGVVLMHDGGGDRSQTVEALRQLLPWLVAQGYTFDFPAGG